MTDAKMYWFNSETYESFFGTKAESEKALPGADMAFKSRAKFIRNVLWTLDSPDSDIDDQGFFDYLTRAEFCDGRKRIVVIKADIPERSVLEDLADRFFGAPGYVALPKIVVSFEFDDPDDGEQKHYDLTVEPVIDCVPDDPSEQGWRGCYEVSGGKQGDRAICRSRNGAFNQIEAAVGAIVVAMRSARS